jgi:hypothetical protein
MPESVKARPTDPYATCITARRRPFKTHATLGQAKNALSLYLRRDEHRGPRGWTAYGDDGVYTQPMILYRLNTGTGEYEPWIGIQEGDRRSQHPELMPARRRDTSQPADEQERAIAIGAVRALRWECTCPDRTAHKPWCLDRAKANLLTQLGADQ